MRIAVVTSSPPMAEGGHMVIARSLVQALQEAGHDADIVITPQNRFGRQASAYLATWLTDVGTADGRKIDRVISLRYPSYAVRHEHHVCWLNHTMREYYDLWERFSATLSPPGRLKEGVRRSLIHAADRYLLGRNVERLFVQSRTVQQRLAAWPEVRSTVLYPPAPQRAYRCEDYGDYIFMVSRLTPLKRADLLIDALATADGAGIRAVIAGEGEDRDRLDGSDPQPRRRGPCDAGRTAVRRRGAGPSRAVPRRVFSDAAGRLRVRDRRGLHVGAGRWSPAATAAARPNSWSTASTASSAIPTPPALAAALRALMDDPAPGRADGPGRGGGRRPAHLAGCRPSADRVNWIDMSYATPLEAKIAKKVTTAITEHGLIDDGDRVMVGLSGGKDSWALLQMLDVLRRRAPDQLLARGRHRRLRLRRLPARPDRADV